MERVISVFTQHLAEYTDQAVDRVMSAELPFYARFAREDLKEMIARVFDALHRDILGGTVHHYPSLFEHIGQERAWQGAPISDLIRGPLIGFQVVSDHMRRAFAGDLEAQLWWAERRHEIAHAGVASMNEAYFRGREEVIAEQHAHIQRLSAPIIPVTRGVLVMPIVGTLDETRAERVIEALLTRINLARAEVVIIDITGVAHVDTGVAAVLGKAAAATRLLGAQVILVGISPEIAQTIVRMGISLGGITTLATLESGVVHALRLQSKAIADIGKA